jgi:hypothetical protein
MLMEINATMMVMAMKVATWLIIMIMKTVLMVMVISGMGMGMGTVPLGTSEKFLYHFIKCQELKEFAVCVSNWKLGTGN